MASPVEEYLEMYDVVQRATERYVDAADYLLGMSQIMRTDGRKALAAIAAGWPTAEQLHALIFESLNAENRLFRCWDKLPDKYRVGILKDPDSAGSVDFGDREFEEVQRAFLESRKLRYVARRPEQADDLRSLTSPIMRADEVNVGRNVIFRGTK